MSVTANYLSMAEVLEIEHKWRLSPVSLTNRDMERLFHTIHHWQEQASQLEYYQSSYEGNKTVLERTVEENRALALIVLAAQQLRQEYETANPREVHYSDDGRLADSLHGT